MSGKYRVFSREFKQSVVLRILQGESVTALHHELQIKRSVLYRWRDAYRKDGAAGFRAAGGTAAGYGRCASRDGESGSGSRATHRGVGTQDRSAIAGSGFFAKSLQAGKGVSPEEHRVWRDGIYGEIRSMMQLEGFQASHACEVARVSRAGFYRHYEEHQPRQAEVALRDLIQQIVLENRCYGYRRVTAELNHQGVVANRKRVLRLMREDNLLAVRKRRFVFTTDSRYVYAVHANLATRLQLTGINQLWVADITYVRLRETFCIWRS